MLVIAVVILGNGEGTRGSGPSSRTGEVVSKGCPLPSNWRNHRGSKYSFRLIQFSSGFKILIFILREDEHQKAGGSDPVFCF